MSAFRLGARYPPVSICLAVLWVSHAQSADTAADTDMDQTVNEGQDITKPVRRIDLRPEYMEPGNSGGSAGQLNKWTLTLRHDSSDPAERHLGDRSAHRDRPFCSTLRRQRQTTPLAREICAHGPDLAVHE